MEQSLLRSPRAALDATRSFTDSGFATKTFGTACVDSPGAEHQVEHHRAYAGSNAVADPRPYMTARREHGGHGRRPPDGSDPLRGANFELSRQGWLHGLGGQVDDGALRRAEAARRAEEEEAALLAFQQSARGRYGGDDDAPWWYGGGGGGGEVADEVRGAASASAARAAVAASEERLAKLRSEHAAALEAGDGETAAALTELINVEEGRLSKHRAAASAAAAGHRSPTLLRARKVAALRAEHAAAVARGDDVTAASLASRLAAAERSLASECAMAEAFEGERARVRKNDSPEKQAKSAGKEKWFWVPFAKGDLREKLPEREEPQPYAGWPTRGPGSDDLLLAARQANPRRHVDWSAWEGTGGGSGGGGARGGLSAAEKAEAERAAWRERVRRGEYGGGGSEPVQLRFGKSHSAALVAEPAAAAGDGDGGDDDGEVLFSGRFRRVPAAATGGGGGRRRRRWRRRRRRRPRRHSLPRRRRRRRRRRSGGGGGGGAGTTLRRHRPRPRRRRRPPRRRRRLHVVGRRDARGPT